MASLSEVIQTIIQTSQEAVPEEALAGEDKGISTEELFGVAIRHALQSVNKGSSPYDFENMVVMNFLVLADEHNFTLRETNDFLLELLSD